MVHVTRPCHFQGGFVFCGLGLHVINVPVKIEVSIFTHYEDMKGDTKCGKWGNLG